MSKLNSHHVVQYVESGKAKSADVYWIVMEMLAGQPLDELLNAGEDSVKEEDAIKVINRLYLVI